MSKDRFTREKRARYLCIELLWSIEDYVVWMGRFGQTPPPPVLCVSSHIVSKPIVNATTFLNSAHVPGVWTIVSVNINLR